MAFFSVRSGFFASATVVPIPNQIVGDGYWCGDKLEENSVFFLKPNSELKFRTPSKSDIFVAVVDMQLLSEYAENIEELDPSRITSISEASSAPIDLCNAFRINLTHLFNGLFANPLALEKELIQRELLDNTMHIICDGLFHLGKVTHHAPGQFVHRHIVEKTRELILSRHSQPPTIADICKELRISRRTLHYAFHKVLGVNPISYLRYIRLHGARQVLLSTPPGRLLICDIAAQWGFLHTGMFCTYYRQLFGETPSTTLARTTSDNVTTYKPLTARPSRH